MCRYVIENCPSPFIASGWEVGCGDYYNANYGNVITGQSLRELDTTHILRRAYEYHFKTRGETQDISRHSNDQCALHFAIRGEGSNYTAYTHGKITLSKKGVCTWEKGDNGKQGYIQKSRDKDLIAEEIEFLMMEPVPAIDMSPPEAPQELTSRTDDQARLHISWRSSIDPSPGSWVIAYRIYFQDELVHTAYGTQVVITENYPKDSKLEIRALNASGIESESSWISL